MAASIYRHATITLSATVATTGDAGLFFPRERTKCVAMTYNTRDGNPDCQFFMTHPRHDSSFAEDVTYGVLNTRGWILQERVFSRRIVHFGKDQLHWECMSVTCSEDGRDGIRFKDIDRSLAQLIFEAPIQSCENPQIAGERPATNSARMYDYWYDMLENYTSRALTFEEDNLPALSGLANLCEKWSGDHYVAGLWKGNFGRGLIWCGSNLSQPARFLAPSWSWASLLGAKYFLTHSFSSAKSALGNIQISIETTNAANRYGQVKAGQVSLSGPCRQIFDHQFHFADVNVPDGQCSAAKPWFPRYDNGLPEDRTSSPIEVDDKDLDYYKQWQAARATPQWISLSTEYHAPWSTNISDEHGIQIGEAMFDDPSIILDHDLFILLVYNTGHRVSYQNVRHPQHFTPKGEYGFAILLRRLKPGNFCRIGLASIDCEFFTDAAVEQVVIY